MPNVIVPAAATGLPSANLLRPDLRFDRAAILRAAHAEARATMADNAKLGIKPWPYSLALKHALRAVWSDAQAHLYCARRDAELAAMDAETARLIQARAHAAYTDSTAAMISTITSIDARLADIQRAAR